MALSKQERRQRIRYRIRRTVVGTAVRPRLSVFRSNKEIYAQLIDDVAGVTLASASTMSKDFAGKSGGNIEAAKEVGLMLAKNATAKGIETVVFDRSGYIYHGRVAALAEGAREGGLKF